MIRQKHKSPRHGFMNMCSSLTNFNASAISLSLETKTAQSYRSCHASLSMRNAKLTSDPFSLVSIIVTIFGQPFGGLFTLALIRLVKKMAVIDADI